MSRQNRAEHNLFRYFCYLIGLALVLMFIKQLVSSLDQTSLHAHDTALEMRVREFANRTNQLHDHWLIRGSHPKIKFGERTFHFTSDGWPFAEGDAATTEGDCRSLWLALMEREQIGTNPVVINQIPKALYCDIQSPPSKTTWRYEMVGASIRPSP